MAIFTEKVVKLESLLILRCRKMKLEGCINRLFNHCPSKSFQFIANDVKRMSIWKEMPGTYCFFINGRFSS